MAIVPDRKLAWQKEIERLQSQSAITTDMQNEIQRLLMLCEEEESKRKRQKVENVRRKHNYLPLIVQLLRMLGEKGQLLPLYEKAKQRAVAKTITQKKSWFIDVKPTVKQTWNKNDGQASFLIRRFILDEFFRKNIVALCLKDRALRYEISHIRIA